MTADVKVNFWCGLVEKAIADIKIYVFIYVKANVQQAFDFILAADEIYLSP